MKKIFTTLAIALITLSVQAQNVWNIDKAHSKVGFSVSHFVVSEVDGNFRTFEGTVATSKDDFSDAVFTFTIDVNSINTDNANRDGHLKSEDFFFAEEHPQITFVSTGLEMNTENRYTLKGNLTMRGVTKEIELDAKYGGTINLGGGNFKAGFVIKGTLDRMEYGVAWNKKTKEGSLAVGKDIDLVIKLELNKQ